MIFNKHSEYEGKHALLSASKHSWLSDTDEKLISRYIASFSAPIGTLCHAYAKDRIEHHLPMEDNRSEKNALLLHLLVNDIPRRVIDIDNLFYNVLPYVNDAIGFKMTPEQVLYYSDNAFGTADAIGYSRNTLRIHDLKTGATVASMDQLMIYAAWFFLEYKNVKPVNFAKSKTELRIYQNHEVLCYTPTNAEISGIMEKIVHGDATIENFIVEV